MTRTERILSKPDGVDPVEVLPAGRDTVAVWDYDLGVDHQSYKLFRQGRIAAWTVDDLELDGHVPPETLQPVERDLSRIPPNTPFSGFDAETWRRWDNEIVRFTLSQTLHGEHMGVLCGAALCEVGESWDVKLFAATQTADEARHLEAFERYLSLLGGPYPVNGHLQALFKDALTSKSWDLIYIATQVMVEGMALGALSWIADETEDHKLRKMLRLTLADEARHVAFGAHALKETVDGLSAAEVALRIEFIDDVAHSLADRLVPVVVADQFGLDRKAFVASTITSPTFRRNQARCLRHIAPMCAKLGLLDLEGGRLRHSFVELGLFDQPNERPVRKTRVPVG